MNLLQVVCQVEISSLITTLNIYLCGFQDELHPLHM